LLEPLSEDQETEFFQQETQLLLAQKSSFQVGLTFVKKNPISELLGDKIRKFVPVDGYPIPRYTVAYIGHFSPSAICKFML
jgi:hypothetical protein